MPKTILIVDDSACIRSVLRSSIERAGFSVCAEAENGRKAIEQALQLRPDLILLDLAMPEMNGAEAAVVLKQRLPQIRIVLFTLYADGLGNDIRQTLNVDKIISKSQSMDAVIESITALLGPSELQSAFSRDVQGRSLGVRTSEKLA